MSSGKRITPHSNVFDISLNLTHKARAPDRLQTEQKYITQITKYMSVLKDLLRIIGSSRPVGWLHDLS